MLESIKRFFVGNPPEPDDNRIYHGPAKPVYRAGILFWKQLAKGDIWVDTGNNNDTYYFNGDIWEKVTS